MKLSTKDRKKLLLVKRTGWGKSMVYFIATKILHDKDFYEGKELSKSGPALMISPLLSLINNQIFHSSHKLKVEQITSQNRIKWKEVEEKI